MAYRNLIFDVGGVLLGYRWKDMLLDYGMTEEEAVRFSRMMFEDPLWKELDLEILPFEEVVGLYQKKFPEHAKDIGWFLHHAERMPLPRPRVWERVHELKKKGYRIYLLSNYSSVLLGLHTKDASFLEDLDGKVVSYEIHKLKPFPEIYKCLFERYHLNPAECLFFDDRRENVEGSIACGMDAKWVTDEETLLGYLKEL